MSAAEGAVATAFGSVLGMHKSHGTIHPGLNLPQGISSVSLALRAGGLSSWHHAPHHHQEQFFAKRTPNPQPGFPASRPPGPTALSTCSRALQTWRWTVSSLSSSRVPAVSSVADAFRGGGEGGVLSFLSWIEKNRVTIPVSSPAPSQSRRNPPSLDSADQGGPLRVPGR